MNLNRVFVLGNLTRDPEVRTLPSGHPVASFGVATNRFYNDNTGAKKQDTEFHNVVVFGKLADICSRYLTKGSLVLIEGRLKTRSWQSSSGMKQFKTEIIANNIQFGPRTMGQTTMPSPENTKNEEIPIIEENYTPPAPQTPDSSPEISPVEDEQEINVKDIPF